MTRRPDPRSRDHADLDGHVERQWLRFRVDLADWLSDTLDDDRLRLGPAPDVDDVPWLVVMRTDPYIVVEVRGVTTNPSYRMGRQTLDRGFVPVWDVDSTGDIIEHEGGPGYERTLSTDDVDEIADDITWLLHEHWGVIAPSFLTVETLAGAEVDFIDRHEDDEPAAATALPALVRPTDRDDLIRWAALALGQHMESVPEPDADGDLVVHSEEGATVVVSPRTHRLEVWTVLARGVEERSVSGAIRRLQRRHPFHRFFLAEDRLVALWTVDAGPFVPEHLTDAVSLTLRLAEKVAADLQARYGRDRDRVDPLLEALSHSAGRMPSADLVAVLLEALDGDTDRAAAWQRQARARRTSSRRRAEAEPDGPLGEVLDRDDRRWRRTVVALERVRATLDEQNVR